MYRNIDLDRPEPQMWERPDMLAALARRDIAQVYAILQRHGFSQRRIAAMTGQSQSEVSEIRCGRQVTSYDVLVRIADGLGVPRGHLGLSHDEATAGIAGALPPVKDATTGRWVVRLPVMLDSYGAAQSLFECVSAPLETPVEPVEEDMTDFEWHKETRALLIGLR